MGNHRPLACNLLGQLWKGLQSGSLEADPALRRSQEEKIHLGSASNSDQ